MNDNKMTFSKIEKPIDGWCERRCLKPLSWILKSYPLSMGLTDEWGALLESLKDIKGLCGSDLTADERTVLVEVINDVHDIVYRQQSSQ